MGNRFVVSDWKEVSREEMKRAWKLEVLKGLGTLEQIMILIFRIGKLVSGNSIENDNR